MPTKNWVYAESRPEPRSELLQKIVFCGGLFDDQSIDALNKGGSGLDVKFEDKGNFLVIANSAKTNLCGIPLFLVHQSHCPDLYAPPKPTKECLHLRQQKLENGAALLALNPKFDWATSGIDPCPVREVTDEEFKARVDKRLKCASGDLLQVGIRDRALASDKDHKFSTVQQAIDQARPSRDGSHSITLSTGVMINRSDTQSGWVEPELFKISCAGESKTGGGELSLTSENAVGVDEKTVPVRFTKVGKEGVLRELKEKVQHLFSAADYKMSLKGTDGKPDPKRIYELSKCQEFMTDQQVAELSRYTSDNKGEPARGHGPVPK